jgi:endoglucanase
VPWERVPLSQVGYAPGMRKELSWKEAFASFVLLDAESQEPASERFSSVEARSVNRQDAGIERVWVGDFSSFARPGRYLVQLDTGQRSWPFSIGKGVFAPVVLHAQRMFYYQRAFTEKKAPYADPPFFHADTSKKAPPGIEGGWYDAGDLSVYTPAVAISVFWMLEAFLDFGSVATDDTRIPESGNGLADILDEARIGLRFLLSMQAENGGFRHTVYAGDHGTYGNTTPETIGPYSVEKGTFYVATGHASAALAYAASAFQASDPGLAQRCLTAARRGFDFLESHSPKQDGKPSSEPYYAKDDKAARTSRLFASAGLLFATSDPRYRTAFARDYAADDYHWISDFNHAHYYAAHLYLRSKLAEPHLSKELREAFAREASITAQAAMRSPFQNASTRKAWYWGSISNGFHLASQSIKAYLLDRSRKTDRDQALAQVHYTLGRNYYAYSFVTGLSGTSRAPTDCFHHWMETLHDRGISKLRNIPGFLVAGPNENPEPNDTMEPRRGKYGYFNDPLDKRGPETPLEGRFTDNDSWSTNEVSIAWQAAALYGLYFAKWVASGEP